MGRNKYRHNCTKSDVDSLDSQLSRLFAEKVYRIRDSLLPEHCEDFRLLERGVCIGIMSGYRAWMILRMSPQCVFMYDTRSYHPFPNPFDVTYHEIDEIYPSDSDGIRLVQKDPALDEKGNAKTVGLTRIGTIIEEGGISDLEDLKIGPNSLVTDFISMYYPPTVNYIMPVRWAKKWNKHTGPEKEAIIRALIEKVEQAFRDGDSPMRALRVRVKE